MKSCLAVVGGLVLLFIVLIVGCTGYAVYKGKGYAESIETAFNDLQATNAAFPFEIPEDGRLDPARVQTFLTVRDGAVGPIEDVQKELDRLKEMDGSAGSSPWAAFKTGMGAVGEMFEAFAAVPRDLRKGLEAARMSYAEYEWITETVHATLIFAARDGEPEAEEMVQELEALSSEEFEWNDKKMDYGSMRRRIERLAYSWKRENLDTILAAKEGVTGNAAKLILDSILIERGLDSPEGG